MNAHQFESSLASTLRNTLSDQPFDILDCRVSAVDNVDDEFDVVFRIQKKVPVVKMNGSNPAVRPPSTQESVYLPNGKINSSLLEKNAKILAESGDLQLAHKIFTMLLKEGDEPAVAHLGLADIAAGQKQSVDAKKHYKLSIAFRPSVEAYQGLAKILIDENEDREAAITLQRALFIKDISTETRFEVHKASANCLFRSGDAVNALREYEKALEVRPGDLEIFCNLGTLYLEQGKYENARGYFLKSLDKDPKKETAALGMGLAEIGMGQREAAYDWFLKTLEIQPKNSTAIFNLVKCAYELKRYERAEAMLSSYVEGAPVSPYLLYSLAGLHFHVGKFDASARIANQVLQIKPDHSGAKALLELIERQSPKK